MSDMDLERAKRTMRAYGIPFGEALTPCGHGCAGADRIAAGPATLAGDLWVLEACGRCLLGRAVRADASLQLPAQLVCPETLWLRHAGGGAAHRVFFHAGSNTWGGEPTPFMSACGHPFQWPDEPVWSIRQAFSPNRDWRCGTCAGAKRHRQAVLHDQSRVWRELVLRAQAELDAAGHPVPWERVS